MKPAARWAAASSLAAAIVVMSVPAADAKGAARARAAVPHTHAAAPHARAAMPHAPAHRAAAVNRGGMYRNRGMHATQNNGAIISKLHATLAHLAQADHDYQGHRARAMQHIGSAIRTLEPASARVNQANPALAYINRQAKNGTGAAAATAGGNAPKKKPVSQTTSDQHVRNGIQALNQIGTHLSNYGTTSQHSRAITSIQSAMQELNVALKTR